MQTQSLLSDSNLNEPMLPPIVFGTSALGNLYQAIDDDLKREIVSQWFQQFDGVVAADSAGKYGAGLALESMSKSMSELGIGANDILISNKLGWRRVPLKTPEPTFEPGAWLGLNHDAVQDISYAGIRRCWEQGAELLNPYRAQLVSVHDPDEYLAAANDERDRMKRWDDLIGAYQALSELKDQGEDVAIGVGAKDWRVSARLMHECELDWVMLATSFTVYTHTADLLEFIGHCQRTGVRVINSAVFHSGFLTGGEFFDYRKVTGDTEQDQTLRRWRETFRELCGEFNVKPAEACVAFGMSPPGIVATALNSSRPERISQNVALVASQPSSEFWRAMKTTGLIDSSYAFVGG